MAHYENGDKPTVGDKIYPIENADTGCSNLTGMFKNGNLDYVVVVEVLPNGEISEWRAVDTDGVDRYDSCCDIFENKFNVKDERKFTFDKSAFNPGSFVPGDRVKCKPDVKEFFDCEGTVRFVHDDDDIDVERDDGHIGCGRSYNGKSTWHIKGKNLIKLNKGEPMTSLVTLTEEQKAGLSKDDQALVELGVVNDKLQLSDSNYLIAFLWKQNKKAVAVEAAKEVAAIKAEQAKKETK